jgi:anti-sigma regulatory factor (Ser/Thr protein kinase)
MEMIVATAHASFPMGDPSRVGEARRHAANLARDAGFGDVDAGRLAIVVTELANNLVRHAMHGQLLLCARPDRREVEVVAIDRGPGIENTARSLGDGFSTGGTPGTGLGAVQRLSQDFDIHSTVPEGTVVLARLRASDAPPHAAPRVCSGGISIAAPGETRCGDAWAVAFDAEGAILLVADGLGHGPDAADAANEAVGEFRRDPGGAPSQLVERMHRQLRGTRGAALAVLKADVAAATVRVAGAGNVIGRIVSGTSDRTLLTQHGTAGVQMRSAHETESAWPEHAVVVLHTDGIESRWRPELLHGLLGRDPTLAAAVLVRQHCRGRDDATVAVLRRS